MSASPNPAPPNDATFRSQRVLPYPPAAIFAAFARPELLAKWWGPSGFTNTFEVFEFTPGGRWKFMMHGPDGGNYLNESVFRELDAPSKIVIEHNSAPHFVLTIALTAQQQQQGTTITWDQAFDDRATVDRLRHIIEPANEQNLDRLDAVLAAQP
jgi:uncharacterized protein YndB with AHSA1/START domain